jgi:signal transduction histidine kinase
LSVADGVLSLHVLLIIFALPLMLTAALVAERRSGDETLRDTRSKLVDAQEQERHRIARELHDDIVQQLTLVILGVDQLRSGSNAGTKTALDKLYHQISVVSKATRDLSHHLYPFTLEYLGLAGRSRSCAGIPARKAAPPLAFRKKMRHLPSHRMFPTAYFVLPRRPYKISSNIAMPELRPWN